MKENKILQRGRYLDTDIYFDEFNKDFDNYDFVDIVISPGSGYTFGIKIDRSIWTCGYNVYGQLGLGDTTNRNVFTKVNIDNVKKISSYSYNTFILKNDGTIYSCGLNERGALGLGDTTNRNTFTKVNIDNVKDVICGGLHTFIIKNDGTV
ncbi:RCC1 domain-containing protein, partial [Clostridioides difficile]